MTNVVTLEGVISQTTSPYVGRPPAAPFLKWAGGKRSLIPEISARLPDDISTYWEPFVGGGAVFFTFANSITRAYLSDLNHELILTYQAVKTSVDPLIGLLSEHEVKHRHKSYYTKVRSQDPTETVAIAARFIYLNKTCFNGLYRVNKSGKFNVPRGNYKKPDICNVDRLRAASSVLDKSSLKFGDFERHTNPGAGDFVYCDPPYDDCFTGYQAGGFDREDQKRLRDAAELWSKSGAKIMISNSDTDLIRRLYTGKDWTLHEIAAPRLISADASTRGTANELLITNYA